MRLLCALFVCTTLGAQDASALKAHVSFLASDALEGRATPSHGLDVAAEYIAAQFRRAGLEPILQTADYFQVTPNWEGFELTVEAGGKSFSVPADRISFQHASAVSIEKAAAVKLAPDAGIDTEAVRGKLVLLLAGEARRPSINLRQLQAAKPAAVVVLSSTFGYRRPHALVSAEFAADPPILRAGDADLLKAVEAGPAVVTLRIPEPAREPVKLRNVAAVVRGADPALQDSYVLVSAHYDHVAPRTSGDGDRIMNGANDNASGTASMLEIAAAAARAQPRRSVLFIAWFGEEVGLLGSRYYVRHPLVPLEKTIANVNIEQTGRTDDPQGSMVARAALTGHDFSEVGTILADAAARSGVKIEKDEKRSDSYFSRSDNVTFAEAGIPAHTICVAFEYADYHRPGDEWDKLDYINMERVTRAIAAGVLDLAHRAEPPRWNERNPRAARYVRKKTD